VVYTKGWEWTRISGLWYRPRPLDDAVLGGYEIQPDGTAGAVTSLGMTPRTLFMFDTEVDDGSWARTYEGCPLVRIKVPGGDPRWFDRGLITDPRFASTTGLIDSEAVKGQHEIRTQFWTRQRAAAERLGKVRLLADTTLMDPETRETEVLLADTTVPAHGVAPGLRVDDRQLSPFSLQVKVGGRPALVNPDLFLGGYAGEHRAAAVQQGLAVRLTAADIMAAFTRYTADSPLAGRLPPGGWLNDDSLHYVSEDQMGAVLVVKALPLGADAISAASSTHPDEFARGKATSGVYLLGQLFVQEKDLGTGVEYHEAVHSLSHWAMAHTLGSDFNEGVTEYFARHITRPLADERKVITADTYAPQLAGIGALLEHGITPGILADAYFGGDLHPLFAAFAAVTSGKLSLQGYAASLGTRTAYAARQVLRRAIAGTI
jgi:hypothetical protein